MLPNDNMATVSEDRIHSTSYTSVQRDFARLSAFLWYPKECKIFLEREMHCQKRRCSTQGIKSAWNQKGSRSVNVAAALVTKRFVGEMLRHPLHSMAAQLSNLSQECRS